MKNTSYKEKIYDIDSVFDGFDQRGAIYVSNFQSACMKTIRSQYNIKAVISMATQGYLESHDQLIDYLYIPAKDTDDYQISKHFQETFVFLDKHRRTGNVLVHCMVGKSRSATIVAAYLLKKFRYSLSTVLNMLKRKRKIIDPNPGFIKQLQNYCQKIGVQKGQYHHHKKNSKSTLSQKSTLSHKTLQKYTQNQQKIIPQLQPYQTRYKTNHISQKIQKLRQKYLHKCKLKQKNNNLYIDIKILHNSGSIQLKVGSMCGKDKEVKSVQLS